MTKDCAHPRRRVLKTLGAGALAGLAGCTGGGDGDDDQETVQAAWIYISEVGDMGWSWAHDQGRQWVEEEFDWLETDYSESVLPADGKQVVEQYTRDDYDVIFGTTFEYMDPMFEVAQENEDVYYEHCSGYRSRENMARYFGRMYQARFLSGVAAGMVTDADELGYVAAFPTAEVVRGINAFTLGARSVNDEVTTRVRWTNAWFDPQATGEAAQSLIDEGVDVMAQHQDSTAAVNTAEDAGIWSVGYNAPMGQFGGDTYLTSPIWNWEVYYAPRVEAVHDGEWETHDYWRGFDAEYDGKTLVDLDDWGPNVPEDVKSKVEEDRSAIESGDLDPWAGSQFEGESDEFLFQEMGSYVEGVAGSVPD